MQFFGQAEVQLLGEHSEISYQQFSESVSYTYTKIHIFFTFSVLIV